MSGTAVQNHRIHHDQGVEIEIRDRRAEHKMRDGQRHEQPAAGSGQYLRSISGTKTGSDHSVIDAELRETICRPSNQGW